MLSPSASARLQRLQAWRASCEPLDIEAMAAQEFHVGPNPYPQRFEIQPSCRRRVQGDLLEADLQHARGATPELLCDLVVANRNLDQSDVQLPQFVGDALETLFQDLVRLEVVAGVESPRRFNEQRAWHGAGSHAFF